MVPASRHRRFGYREHHCFGNPGGYRSWYIGVNGIGYNAVSPALDRFDDADDTRTRLLPGRQAAYRASAPINTVVFSGTALYAELQNGSFFGTSLGADQDLVRVADPEYQVLDSWISRARSGVRDRRWRRRYRRWAKKPGVLYSR